jgi:cell division protease FtsH
LATDEDSVTDARILMPFLKKILKFVKTHRHVLVAGLLVLLALLAYKALTHQATTQSNMRKGPVALEFEANPRQWLEHPSDVAELRKALDAETLSAVGQVASPPNLVLYTLKDGKKASVRVPNCNDFVCAGTVLGKLEDQSVSQGFYFVRVDVDPRSTSERILGVLGWLTGPLTMVTSMLVAVYAIFRMQAGSGGGAAKLAERPELRFKDVIGNKEAKNQLIRVATFLKNPGTYQKIGARAPRGVLLVGPPGTGKTLLAKALAGETKSNFISVDGSYFTSMFYGAGVSKVKTLFELARKSAPCVLFIDEIDGISKRTRSPDMRGADSESNRIINRILVEMDGFEDMSGVVVVGATNHESNVDEALRRPGRFDALVRLTLPTLPDRTNLFDMYLGQVTREPEIDMGMLARMTAGASPADIANLVNKASSNAAELQAEAVGTAHVVNAIEAFRMGGEVSPIKDLLSPETRERLAVHEAGHALIAHWLNLGSVDHLTIEPRGEALGVTYVSRESEDPLFSETELVGRLAMMLAGREAELLVLRSVSSGASDDLRRATELAVNMVGSLGFSKEFGVLSVAGLPKELMGPDLQTKVLRAAQTLLLSAQQSCSALLTAHKDRLIQVQRALLEKEVLSGVELLEALGPSTLARYERTPSAPPADSEQVAFMPAE